MSAYVLSSAAQADLREIGSYLAQNNLRAALQAVGRIIEKVESLAEMPRHGPIS